MDDWRDAYRLPGVYENLCRYQEGAMAQSTDPAVRRYRKSSLVVTAWAAERYQEAATLMNELDGNFDASAAASFDVSPAIILDEIRLHSGPGKAKVEKKE